MKKIRAIVSLIFSLGIINVIRVQIYRLLLFLGVHASQRVRYLPSAGDLFNLGTVQFNASKGLRTPKRWAGTHDYFGWYFMPSDSIPDWHFDPFSRQTWPGALKPWWTIDEFAAGTADVKCIWEMSRFTWIIPFAQRARLGETSELEKINRWYSDWLKQNSPGLGPNWMCGQEASIRVLHATSASMILGCLDAPSDAFLAFLLNHSRRISPTRSYAIAQRNNHAVSEGVALFIAGTVLEKSGVPEGKRTARQGQRLLERAVARLVYRDGAFSQVSSNYQRMVIDLVTFAELFRRHLGLEPFSRSFYDAGHLLLGWLRDLYIPTSNSVPNLGGNDGSRVNQVLDSDYRNFADSLHNGEAVFSCSGRAITPRSREFLQWLRVEHARGWDPLHNCDSRPPLMTVQKFGRNDSIVFLRQPVYHPFRPANCDALHLDFWRAGENILRDAGSYSYREELPILAVFHGTKGHNTVTFDEEETMPQIGRFLYAHWLRPAKKGKVHSTSPDLAGAYLDSRGNHHYRSVDLGDNQLEIEDRLSGNFRKAVVRWRLIPGDWILSNGKAESPQYTLEIQDAESVPNIRLTRFPESRYYMASELIPVLEIEVNGPTILKTSLRWAQ